MLPKLSGLGSPGKLLESLTVLILKKNLGLTVVLQPGNTLVPVQYSPCTVPSSFGLEQHDPHGSAEAGEDRIDNGQELVEGIEDKTLANKP